MLELLTRREDVNEIADTELADDEIDEEIVMDELAIPLELEEDRVEDRLGACDTIDEADTVVDGLEIEGLEIEVREDTMLTDTVDED